MKTHTNIQIIEQNGFPENRDNTIPHEVVGLVIKKNTTL